MGFSFTSQGCLTAAESILKSADKIAELLESFEQAKQSIMSNYSSEAANAIEAAFTKIQNNGPEFHDAVSHIEDETKGEQEIVEEYRKGYKIGNKVIRHSMVIVAN